jgi:hypothetical protein
VLLGPVHPTEGYYRLRLPLVEVGRDPFWLDAAPAVVVKKVVRLVKGQKMMTQILEMLQNWLRETPGIRTDLPAAVSIRVDGPLRIGVEATLGRKPIDIQTTLLRRHLWRLLFNNHAQVVVSVRVEVLAKQKEQGLS